MVADLSWRDALTPVGVGQVLALARSAAAVDGVEPLSEQAVNAVVGTVPGRHLLACEDGALVGYANIVGAAAEAVVAPGARGRGVGRAVVAEALDAAGEGAAVWAHGDLPAARAVAGRLGLVVRRELLQLRRGLDGMLPEPVLPAGVVVRPYAGPADDAELLRVNNAAFSWHPEQGGWGPAELAVRLGADWFDPAGLLLAWGGGGAGAGTGRLRGFHWTKVHPGADGVGEVFILAVDPAAQGGGLGRALTLAGLAHLRGRGMRTVLLYVEADNGPAVRTYTALGFTNVHSDVAFAKI